MIASVLIILLGVIFYVTRENSVRKKILQAEKLKKVSLFYLKNNIDTMPFVTIIDIFKFKDSLLSVAEKEYLGYMAVGTNFPNYKSHKDSTFYFVSNTSDSFINKIASINKDKNFYKEYYVYSKAIHFK